MIKLNGATSPNVYPSLKTPDEETALFELLSPPPSTGQNGQFQSGLTLTWRDLSVWVTKKRPLFSRGPKQEYTQILNNVSGIARGGRLIAIMGASGAGKTTLLATVSQRIKGKSHGEIYVNGESVSSEALRRMSGFVPQQDLAILSLTVKEHMEFMSRLKLDTSVSNGVRQRWVSSLLNELGLNKCEHTRLSALSGGERKRLSLAVQLLTDPPLLFCDEPTTGLDSYSASAVVEKLRELSARGIAVVCTIHQPASGIFDLFHELILLAGGRVAYQGDVSAALEYFRSKGLTCPATYNAAEFYVSQVAIRPGREERCSQQVTRLCDQFASSNEGLCLRSAVDDACQNTPDLSLLNWRHQNGAEALSRRSLERPAWYSQLYWITWRQVLDGKRKMFDNMVRLIAFMFVGLVISVPFIGVGTGQTSIQNTQGLLYLIVVETIFTFNYSVLNTFPAEMPVLLREISDTLYKPAPYYLSKIVMLVPQCVIAPFFYMLLIFFVVGLPGGVLDFLTLCSPVILCAATATAYGCMMSALFESVSTASLLSVPFEMITLVFSGLYLKLGTVPFYLSWIRYISNFYYANEAVNVIQWQKVESIECSEIPGAPCLHSGHEVLQSYDLSEDNLPLDFLGLLGIFCFCHMVGFIALRKRSKAQSIY